MINRGYFYSFEIYNKDSLSSSMQGCGTMVINSVFKASAKLIYDDLMRKINTNNPLGVDSTIIITSISRIK